MKSFFIPLLFLLLVFPMIQVPVAQQPKAGIKGLLIVEKDGKRIISDPLNVQYLRWMEYLYGGQPQMLGDLVCSSYSGSCFNTNYGFLCHGSPPLISRKESYILLGSGTTAFSFTDRTLTNYITTSPSLIRVTTSGNAMNITVTGTYSATSTTTVNEIGYAISYTVSYISCGAPYGPFYYLVIRDVLPNAITVTAGQTLNVTFIIMFNQ
jgi:hypothetical protein